MPLEHDPACLSSCRSFPALTGALEREGWEVHTQVEDPSLLGPPLEEVSGTEQDKEAEVLRRLKSVDPKNAETKRALIVRNSHMGGHKFAGNVIVSFLGVPPLPMLTSI